MKKPRQKRTPELDAKIRADNAAGYARRENARRNGVSTGTVQTVVHEAAPAAPAAPAPRAPLAAPAALLPADDGASLAERVTRDLERQAGLLRAEGDRLLSSGDNAGFAANSRILSGVLKTLATLAPDDKQVEGIYVTTVEMDAAAARVRKRWHDLADNLVRVSQSPLADTISKLLAGREAAR